MDFRIEDLVTKLEGKKELGTEAAAAAARALADGEVAEEAKRDFLIALADKGETPGEVAAIAEVFRSMARDPGLGEVAGGGIDIVGTGGDRSGTFNLSTATALLAAAMGCTVIKHGNRSVSSKSGSADLLRSMGVDLEASSEGLKAQLKRTGFVFLFAPNFHPAFRHIMPVRKALAAEGVVTIFNLLGPLINPARPAFEIMGVANEGWLEPMAETLELLGLRGGYVVHSVLHDGRRVDELTVGGVNQVVGFGSQRGELERFEAERFGLVTGDPADLNGGTPEENLQMLKDLADGKAPRGLRDSVLLGAGFAALVAGRAGSVEAGIARGREVLEKGIFADWLRNLVEGSA